MKKAKQIGFLTAIMISVGSTIGAGIFFKNATVFTNAGGSLAFTIATWMIAFIGVMAIGIALIEVTSASKDNGGVIEWVRKFTPKRMSKFSGSYMILVYLPLNYFGLPLYAVQSLADVVTTYSPGFHFAGYQTALIGFGFFIWLAFMSFFQFKAATRLQWVFTVIKFLPMILIIIFAVMHLAGNGAVAQVTLGADHLPTGLTAFSPWLGIMASIPAIMFAVDGFYTITSMRSKLVEPKKLGVITAISISTTMGAYLIYAVVTATTGQTGFAGIDFIKDNASVRLIINASIMMAVLGIVNGFAMATYQMYESIDEQEQIGIVKWFKKKFKNMSSSYAAFYVSVIFGVIAYLVFVPISLFLWEATTNGSYGTTSANIYELTDLLTNFISLFVFIFMGFAILGAIVNRKTKRVEVTRSKYFLPAAWVAVIFIGIGAAYMLIDSVVNMFGVNDANVKTSVIKFIILMILIAVSFIPLIIDFFKETKNKKTLVSKAKA